MQSDGNSFYGDVVSDRFTKTFWDEDNILDQIYKIKYVRIIFMMILILYNIIRKCIKDYTSTKTQFYELLVVMGCISLYIHFLPSLLKFKNFISNKLKRFAPHILVLITVFVTLYHVKAVQDSAKNCFHLIAYHCTQFSYYTS